MGVVQRLAEGAAQGTGPGASPRGFAQGDSPKGLAQGTRPGDSPTGDSPNGLGKRLGLEVRRRIDPGRCDTEGGGGGGSSLGKCEAC